MSLAVILAGGALAQSSTTTYITDINGRRVEASDIQSADHARTERWQSINGRSIPLEQVEEKVISEGPTGKVTERIVKKFTQTGDLASTQKIVTEEQKTAAGTTVRERVYRGDVNGNMREEEQRTTETRGSGVNTTSEITISRPNLNGGIQTVEKRTTATSGTEAKNESNETVYRLNQSGEMTVALRQVTVSTKQGDRSTSNTAYYEPGVSGSLELARQSDTTTVKSSNGRETTETNLYGRSAYGIVQESGAPQQIREQQIVERTKAADGSVIETLSVRRPSISDPTHLGALQQISQTVCRGKCD